MWKTCTHSARMSTCGAHVDARHIHTISISVGVGVGVGVGVAVAVAVAVARRRRRFCLCFVFQGFLLIWRSLRFGLILFPATATTTATTTATATATCDDGFLPTRLDSRALQSQTEPREPRGGHGGLRSNPRT